MGDVKNGTVACWFQALSTNYCYLGSILWTTLIGYQLYTIVCLGNNVRTIRWRYAHLFCWIFPIIPTLLVLTTNWYGKDSEDVSWCFISRGEIP